MNVISSAPTTNGKHVMRVRFYVNIEACNGDYRPVVWPIPHPYWCSGESETDFVLVAYVETKEQLMAQWPEAANIEVLEKKSSSYFFSDRFSKPTWFK